MINKQILESLYNSGKSMMEISKITGRTDREVRYWMEKHNVKRRSYSEAVYLKANPNGDPFKIKTKLDKNDMFKLGLGLGIFWGEGTKVYKNSVRVANSNPKLIKKFREFLINICGVKVDKIHYSLICFNNSDKQVALGYWSLALNIPIEEFGRVVQIPTQGKGKYLKKSSMGVCTIAVHNVKLKSWIDLNLKKLEA